MLNVNFLLTHVNGIIIYNDRQAAFSEYNKACGITHHCKINNISIFTNYQIMTAHKAAGNVKTAISPDHNGSCIHAHVYYSI